MIRIGPAGWSYADWAGIVYPSPKPRKFDPLPYIARFFDTVEVNSTFYRPATAEVAASWIRRTSANPNFRFTAKLWRRFTHQRTEAWTTADVDEARSAFETLASGARLGALLLQFPWSFRRTEENRAWLDDLASTFGDLPLVIEVRHESWNTPEFFESLREREIGFVNIDQPLFKDSIRPSARSTAPVGYIRVHGRNYKDWWRKTSEPHERYDYLYSAEELRPWAGRTKELASDEEVEDVYVVTNNHYRGKAVANALMVASMVEGRKVPGPPGLFEEYGPTIEEFVLPAQEEPPG